MNGRIGRGRGVAQSKYHQKMAWKKKNLTWTFKTSLENAKGIGI